ncbi:MAG: V-type ATPase subunit [Eubacteriales bacterium]|nr:V-type ATPase subunit [Eubacteriales bacterium]
MPQPSYAYACARISALEKSLFGRDTVRRMAEGSLEDALRMLSDAKYGNLPDATSEDTERMIESVRRQTAETIRDLSPDAALTDLFLLQTDVQNLKMLIKARLLGSTDVIWLDGGLFTREQLGTMVANAKYDLLPEALRNAMNRLEAKLKISQEPQLVSVYADYGYHAHCLNEADRVKEPFIRQYFAALCDFNNVITFLRMRAMGAQKEDLKEVLLPSAGVKCDALIAAYELSAETLTKAISTSVAKSALQEGLNRMLATGSISMLEKARDDYLLSLVNDHRHESMTIFPIVGYYLARDREAKAVRLILTVKRNGLDDAIISERLRELYG